MHLAGKTDEARADLARLALVRKQREEAAKKREDERKGENCGTGLPPRMSYLCNTSHLCNCEQPYDVEWAIAQWLLSVGSDF